MSEAKPASGDSSDQRPQTVAEKEQFSSGGNRNRIYLRDKWGLAVDRVVLWTTGYSPMTHQYAAAQGHPYHPTLILTTTGARTGRRRRANLPYFKVGDELVVRGSNGGGPTDPHWVYNVRASSQAWVRMGWRTRPMHAHVSTGEERERLFKVLSEMSSTTEAYQQMCAPRELPLVVLRDAEQ